MVTQRAASLHADIGEVLLTPETIAQRVGELGRCGGRDA